MHIITHDWIFTRMNKFEKFFNLCTRHDYFKRTQHHSQTYEEREGEKNRSEKMKLKQQWLKQKKIYCKNNAPFEYKLL